MNAWLKKIFGKGTGTASRPASVSKTVPDMDTQEIARIFAQINDQAKTRPAHERAWDAAFRRASIKRVKAARGQARAVQDGAADRMDKLWRM